MFDTSLKYRNHRNATRLGGKKPSEIERSHRKTRLVLGILRDILLENATHLAQHTIWWNSEILLVELAATCTRYIRRVTRVQRYLPNGKCIFERMIYYIGEGRR